MLVCVVVHKQDRNVYCEDWGEALTNKSAPVICVVNLQSGSVSVLHGVPPDVSPGQVRAEDCLFGLSVSELTLDLLIYLID